MIDILTTKEKLINASIKVFAEKGYDLATTLEISKRAEVSEMTLFRHFETKENLFYETIKTTIGNSIIGDTNIDFNAKFDNFLFNILDNKLKMMSENEQIIKMLIRESLLNRLQNELNFPSLIYNEVIKKLLKYKQINNVVFDELTLADLIVGFLLKQIVLGNNIKYHKLKKEEKKDYIYKFINIINIL